MILFYFPPYFYFPLNDTNNDDNNDDNNDGNNDDNNDDNNDGNNDDSNNNNNNLVTIITTYKFSSFTFFGGNFILLYIFFPFSKLS